ncbi:MAG: 4Fe-4S binding protein [Candidatus Ventricola sp.]
MKIKQSVRRKLIQIAAFGLSNAHVGNLAKGRIYTGPWKQFCNPGLNCYSCPAASVSCPIGALQAVTGSMDFSFSFYVVGFLLAVGVLLGRLVCGFLCPFGLLQELIHRIPSPKFRLPGWPRFLKYVILAVFVGILPVAVTNFMGVGDPAFCKYICPSGTLLGGIPLVTVNENLRQMLGALFSWKMLLLAATLVGCVLVYRFFCKVICPLGAIYGVLNRVSLYHLEVDEQRCVHCGKCARICKMDVNPVLAPDSAECIRCGACAAACPTGAIRIGFGLRRAKMAPEKPASTCAACGICDGSACAGCDAHRDSA